MKRYFYFLILVLLLGCAQESIEALEENKIECRITVGEYFLKGIPKYKELYEYDNNGKLAKYSEVPEDKTKKAYEIFYENEYDQKGNLIKVSRHKGDNNYIRIDNYSFYDNGKLKALKTDYNYNTYSYFEYNTEGQETSSIINNGYVKKEKSTTYNIQNQLTQEVVKENDVLITTTIYSYGLNQNLEKKEIKDKNKTSVFTYTYNDENKLLKVTNNDGRVIDYTYSLLTIQATTTENGNFINAIKETFDTNGNMLKSFTSFDGSSFVLMKEFTFFPNNSKSQERNYVLKKNSKTESRLYYETNHNEVGKMLNFTEFDEQGNISYEIRNTFICE